MGLVRTGIERLSRGVILKRNLPQRFGGAPVFVTPESYLSFWRLDVEKTDPTLFRSASEVVKSGDVVWDVGANVGLFAVASAGLAGPNGRVLAIEPDAWLAMILHRSASCQPSQCAPIEVLPIAVSDQIQLAHLNIAMRGRASNSLKTGHSQAGGVRSSQSALCVTLDWLLALFDPPKVLKIDVEGLEVEVLQGARQILATARPIVVCEVGSENADSVTGILKEYGYSLFDADKAASDRKEIPKAAWNTMAFPKTGEGKLIGAASGA